MDTASTGLYREETWPANFTQMGSNELQAHFLNEINCGIDGTDIKAGHIKTAIANGSENEFNVLKAVVPVANETGLMVTAHTSYGGHGYCRIIDYVIPAMIDNGIAQKTIDQITIYNPARLLQY